MLRVWNYLLQIEIMEWGIYACFTHKKVVVNDWYVVFR